MTTDGSCRASRYEVLRHKSCLWLWVPALRSRLAARSAARSLGRDDSLLTFAPLPLPPRADECHKRRERRRRLAPARVIEEWPGEWRAPILQHAGQRAGFDRLAHIALEGRPEADAVMGRLHRHA